MEKEQLNINRENDLLIIGGGVMGTGMVALAGKQDISQVELVGIRQKEQSFTKLVKKSQHVLLATRQEAGLDWLSYYGRLFEDDQALLSIMAFVDFDTLEGACQNEKVRIARIMTDTSFESIYWSDDGQFDQVSMDRVGSILKLISNNIEYKGQRNDEAILKETLKACNRAFVTAALVEAVEAWRQVFKEDDQGSEREIFQLVESIQNSHQGGTYQKMVQDVATSGGATEAGLMAVGDQGLQVAKTRLEVARARALEKREKYSNQWCDMI